jgi:hypothetical protein
MKSLCFITKNGKYFLTKVSYREMFNDLDKLRAFNAAK